MAPRRRVRAPQILAMGQYWEGQASVLIQTISAGDWFIAVELALLKFALCLCVEVLVALE